jgi:hypothetical protein
VLTDIYAFDLNPNGSPNNIHLTGLNASNPAIVLLSSEVLIGNPDDLEVSALSRLVDALDRDRTQLERERFSRQRWKKCALGTLQSAGRRRLRRHRRAAKPILAS